MIINPIIPIWLLLIVFPLYWFMKSKKRNVAIRQFIVLMLLFLINLRPMIPRFESDVLTNDLDLLLVFDTTVSMAANDVVEDKTRLAKAKEDALKIIENLDGARISIISFDNKSRILIPFTYDKKMAISSVDSLGVVNPFYAYGSSLNYPYDDIKKQFEKSKEENKQSVIFMFSDGEITNEEALASYKEISGFVHNGAILGYGTKEGSKMLAKDYFTGEEKYIQDETNYPYVDAISKIDENNLKTIANDLNVSYINMSETNDNELSKKINEIKKSLSYDINKVNTISYEDIYFVFVIPLLGMLIYEFILFKKEFK